VSEATVHYRLRSPPYPNLPLQRALERAEQLYRQERDHLAPLSSAAKAWGMSPTSSGPVQITGALRQYGLVEDDGSREQRKIRLTSDALRILMDKDHASPERRDAVRRCFLAPRIFLEMWEQWKADLPSDQTVIRYLTLDRKLNNLAPYSEETATELLANYKASASFALMNEAPSLASFNERGEKPRDSELPEAKVKSPAAASDPIPMVRHPAQITARGARPMEHERVLSDGILSKSSTYRLIVSGHIGLKEIERLIKKLEIDKEILADDEDDTALPPSNEGET